MQHGQKHCKYLHAARPGSLDLSPELKGSPGRVGATSASLPISVLASLPSLPNIPLSANGGIVTLVAFCQLGAGLRPSHHKPTSTQVYVRPKGWGRAVSEGRKKTLHSKAQPEKASWNQSWAQVLELNSSVCWFVWLHIMSTSFGDRFHMRKHQMIRKYSQIFVRKEIERIQPHGYRQSLSNFSSRNVLVKEGL